MATDKTTTITKPSTTDSGGLSKGQTIAPGLRADVMRKLMETKNTLSQSGSIYVGTGKYETVNVGTDYCKIYETEALKHPGKAGKFLITTSDGLEYPDDSGIKYDSSSKKLSVASADLTTVSATTVSATTVTASGMVQGSSFNATSDRRLKENMIPLEKVEGLLDLPLYEYDYKETGIHSLGCMAQDLKEIAPLLVEEDKNGYLSVKESKLVYYLLMEVKQLRDEVESLRKGE